MGILFFRGVLRLPGTAQLLQQRFYLGNPLRRSPALKKDDGAVGEQPLFSGLLGRLGTQPVSIEHQRIPGLGTLGNLSHSGLLRLTVLGQFPVQRGQILRRGSGAALEAHRTEAEGPQQLRHRLLLCPVADEKAIDLLLVRADFIDFRRGIRGPQGRADCSDIRSAGKYSHADQRVGRSGQLQRHVQRGPGPQPSLTGNETALLSLQPG